MRGTSWVAVVVVVVLGSALGIAAGSFLAWWLPIANVTGTSFMDIVSGPFEGQGTIRLLVIGEDNTAGKATDRNGLSDTLVVMAIDTDNKQVRAISIPRDTRVDIPGHGKQKINHAHVYGGPDLTRTVIEELLGIEIDNYVKVTTTGLRGLVDLLGGVYINIDRDMHYVDRRGGLYIDLKATGEKQLLNGDEAEQYVRFRHDRHGDLGYTMEDGKRVPAGRVVRQQKFMRALANRVISLPTRRERAEFLRKAYEKKYLISDLDVVDWDGLADFFKDIDIEHIKMNVLPGEPRTVAGGSYWIVDDDDLAELVNINMYFAPLKEETVDGVEVLNGCGTAGVADKVAQLLTDEGFSISRTDNAPSFDYKRCFIITRKGKIEPVQRIAKLLDCDDIREEDADKGDVDVTVVVGKDFAED